MKVTEFLEKLFGSKTFRFLLLIFLVGSAALFLSKITSEQWIDIVKWLGAYATARGTVENVEALSGKKKDEAAVVV